MANTTLAADERISRLYQLCDEAEPPLEEVAMTLADMLTRGVVVINNTGEIVLVSSDVLEMFGYSSEEVTGQPVEVLLPVGLQETHVARRNQFLGNASLRQMAICCDVQGQHSEGHLIDITIGLSPVGDRGALAAIRNR